MTTFSCLYLCLCFQSSAFVHYFNHRPRKIPSFLKALGDYTVELTKPLGLLLEEATQGSTRIQQVLDGGSARQSHKVAAGDVLLEINGQNVQETPFDDVMSLLTTDATPVQLTLGDGLGQLNMPKNVVKLLESTQDAYLVDAVVRQVVRELRIRQTMGDLLSVEVIVGASVRNERCQVRFFALFSTDGGITSYSCNVAASAKVDPKGDTEIVSLSCAKDEGLGQTVDIISEE